MKHLTGQPCATSTWKIATVRIYECSIVVHGHLCGYVALYRSHSRPSWQIIFLTDAPGYVSIATTSDLGMSTGQNPLAFITLFITLWLSCLSFLGIPNSVGGTLRLYKKTKTDDILGGLSSLTTQLLDAMDFPMDFVVDGRGYQLSFAIFLADEKAIKEILAVKGAGSYKPCCKCRAIVGRILAPDVRPPVPALHLPTPRAVR